MDIDLKVAAFSFSTDKGDEEIRKVPFVYIPNLMRKIVYVVASYKTHV